MVETKSNNLVLLLKKKGTKNIINPPKTPLMKSSKTPIIILVVLLLSCTNEQQDKTTNDDFSDEKTKELAELIDSSKNSSITSTVELNTIKQQQTYSDSVWELANSNLADCNTPVSSLNFEDKNWSFCEYENELKLYEVKFTKDNIDFTEKYLTKNNQLIYAVEWEKRTADMKDDEATYWNCEYIILDNHVIDYTSLGMGKTEDESFDPQNILSSWKTRKKIFLKL